MVVGIPFDDSLCQIHRLKVSDCGMWCRQNHKHLQQETPSTTARSLIHALVAQQSANPLVHLIAGLACMSELRLESMKISDGVELKALMQKLKITSHVAFKRLTRCRIVWIQLLGFKVMVIPRLMITNQGIIRHGIFMPPL